MALDAELRKQLVDAREVILAEIDEVQCRTRASFKGAPDYRDSYAELQEQLQQIDEILASDAAVDGSEEAPIVYVPVPSKEPASNAPAPNVVVDPANGHNWGEMALLAAGMVVGAAGGAAMHHPLLGVIAGVTLSGLIGSLAMRMSGEGDGTTTGRLP